MHKLAPLALLLLVLASCQSEPGDPCEASGEGFQRQDSCAAYGAGGRCLAFPITCPAGDEVTPNVCEGGECASDDDCEPAWICVATGSVTSNCVPAPVCGL